MKNIYIKNQAKNNFKGWSKQGLEFLFYKDDICKTLKLKVKKAIDKL